MRSPNDRVSPARPRARGHVSRHQAVVRSPHRRLLCCRGCGRRTRDFSTRVEAPSSLHPCRLRVVRDSSMSRPAATREARSGNARTRMAAGAARRGGQPAPAPRHGLLRGPSSAASMRADRRVSRPIGLDADLTGGRSGPDPARRPAPAFRESSGPQVLGDTVRVRGAIAGMVRETPDGRTYTTSERCFPSHVGNHSPARLGPRGRRKAETAEAVQRPNEGLRRTDLAGRSATFRHLPDAARTASHAASRRDVGPAVLPACSGITRTCAPGDDVT
jgi:hypothetical protein